jgi:probable rRNA maturation factor
LDKRAKAQAEGRPVTGRSRHLREYIVVNKQRKHAIDQRSLRRFLPIIVQALRIEEFPFSIVFVADEEMRRYNRQYRGYDKPTDVLSFRGDQRYLGDILISSETAYNQALKSRTLSFEKNICRLILHGLLHLMGYDHETDDGQMRSLERRLRRKFQC